MRKRIYLAGPISKGNQADNLRQFDKAFKELVEAGFAPFNPGWSVFGGATFTTCQDGKLYAAWPNPDWLPHATWLDVDRSWIEVSDALLRLPGESVGADQEEKWAEEDGIPVFHSVSALLSHFAPVKGTWYYPYDMPAAVEIGQTTLIWSNAGDRQEQIGERYRQSFDDGDKIVEIVDIFRGSLVNLPARMLEGNYGLWGDYAQLAHRVETFGFNRNPRWFAKVKRVA